MEPVERLARELGYEVVTVVTSTTAMVRLRGRGEVARAGVMLKCMEGKSVGKRRSVARERFGHEALCMRRLGGRGFGELRYSGREGEFDYLIYETSELAPLPVTMSAIIKDGGLGRLNGVLGVFEVLLKRMHELEIVHLDLKPGNLLYDEGIGEGVVLDFGASVSPWVARECYPCNHYRGTPRYSAPEHLLGGEVGWFSDLYSFGMILREVVSDGVPTELKEVATAREFYRRGGLLPLRWGDLRERFRGKVSPLQLEWLCELTEVDPRKRPESLIPPVPF